MYRSQYSNKLASLKATPDRNYFWGGLICYLDKFRFDHAVSLLGASLRGYDGLSEVEHTKYLSERQC